LITALATFCRELADVKKLLTVAAMETEALRKNKK